jgi:hypothetical protein
MAIKIAGTEVINDDKRFLNNESLPSIRPSLLLDFANSKTLDPRIDFTRSSTATYYDGKTFAKAEENLVKYSQEFDNSYWVKANTAVVAANDTTAPDGTTTADKLTLSGGNDSVSIGTSLSGEYTFSVWLKADSATTVYIGFYNPSDVTSCSVTTSWQRFTHTSTRSGASYPQIWNNGVSITVYAWGAQLEERDSATAYTPTTTQPITNYIPVLQTAASGEARFDHDPVTGESKGLLIEEQRTNLLTNSATYGNSLGAEAIYTKTNNSTDVITPDGNNLSTKLVTGNTGNSWYWKVVNVNANTTYTISVWVRTAPGTTATWNLQPYPYNANVPVSATDKWQRFSTTFTTNSTNLSVYTGLVSPQTDSTFYVWGWQMEVGAFPTSYIPTSGSQVTRSGDLGQINNVDFADPSKGTLYAEYMVTHPEQTQGYSRGVCSLFNINDSASYYNSITLTGVSGGTSNSQGLIYSGSSNYMNQASPDITGGTYYKHIVAYAENDGAYHHTLKTSVATDSTVATPQTLNTMRIGSDYFSDRNLDGYIKKLAYYPTRLTNAELQALTED